MAPSSKDSGAANAANNEGKEIEVKAVSEGRINAKNPRKEKKITAEELLAKARHMQEIADDQDIIRRIEQTAAAFSEVDVNDIIKGIQEIVDSDNEEAANKEKQQAQGSLSQDSGSVSQDEEKTTGQKPEKSEPQQDPDHKE